MKTSFRPFREMTRTKGDALCNGSTLGLARKIPSPVMQLNKKQRTERVISTKYITPALEAAGWNKHTQSFEEVSFTDETSCASYSSFIIHH